MAQSISREVINNTGLPGAQQPSRYVGATISGYPVSGVFAVGDFIVDRTGVFWICTISGSPGTWTSVNTFTGGTIGNLIISGSLTVSGSTVLSGTTSFYNNVNTVISGTGTFVNLDESFMTIMGAWL